MTKDENGALSPPREEPPTDPTTSATLPHPKPVRKVLYIAIGLLTATLTALIIKTIIQNATRRHDAVGRPRITSIHKPDLPAPLRRPPGPIAVARAPVIAPPPIPTASPTINGPTLSFAAPAPAPDQLAPAAPAPAPPTRPTPPRHTRPIDIPIKRVALPVQRERPPLKRVTLPVQRERPPLKRVTLPVQKSASSKRAVPPPPPPPEPIDLDAPPLNDKNDVEPAWWPCQEGQIKGNRDSMKYHVPGGRFYTKTYEGVDCFDTEEQAQAAGFTRSKR